MTFVDALIAKVEAWDGVTTAPHRFGGVEFRLGEREVGHVHRGSAQLDVPYTKPISRQLIAEGLADEHHVLPGSNWITFRMRGEDDAARAVWLLRLSYVQKVARARRTGDAPDVDIRAALTALGASDALAVLVRPVENKRE